MKITFHYGILRWKADIFRRYCWVLNAENNEYKICQVMIFLHIRLGFLPFSPVLECYNIPRVSQWLLLVISKNFVICTSFTSSSSLYPYLSDFCTFFWCFNLFIHLAQFRVCLTVLSIARRFNTPKLVNWLA